MFVGIQPKVLTVEARQFPVAIYYERRTPANYLEAAFRKVCKIHEQYAPGGILVFVTGQHEVAHLVKLLSNRYQQRRAGKKGRKRQSRRNTDKITENSGENVECEHIHFDLLRLVKTVFIVQWN